MKFRTPPKMWFVMNAILGSVLLCCILTYTVFYKYDDPATLAMMFIVACVFLYIFLAYFIERSQLPAKEKNKRLILGDDGELIELNIDEKRKHDDSNP